MSGEAIPGSAISTSKDPRPVQPFFLTVFWDSRNGTSIPIRSQVLFQVWSKSHALGFRIWGLGLGYRVRGLKVRVCGLGFKVKGVETQQSFMMS